MIIAKNKRYNQKEREKQMKKYNEFYRNWFNLYLSDSPGYRSPFPKYMIKDLKEIVFYKFELWLNSFSKQELNNITQKQIKKKFEELFKKIGLKLAKKEEDKISIQYPYIPRIGDEFHDPKSDPNHKKIGKIMDRFIIREKNKKIVRLILKNKNSKKNEHIDFEINTSQK